VSPLRAVDRVFYAEAPPERLALLRIATGGFAVVYLIWRFRAVTSVAHLHPAEFVPVGVVRLLSAPLPSVWVPLLVLAALAAGAAFVAGFRFRVSGPLFALLFLWTTSYRNSWGMIFHVENLAALQLLLLCSAPAADAFSWDARQRLRPPPSHGRYGWAIRAMTAVTATTYVLAGVAKLKFAGFHWLSGEFLRQQIAHDNLRKIELGSIHAPLGALLVQYSAPFGVLAIVSICLELGAPIALFSRRLAIAWVAAAWSFHVGVAGLMAIIFPYQLTLIAFLPYFELERWSIVRRAVRKLQSLKSSSTGSVESPPPSPTP
jgi:ABC-type multidrug transport system fused ATPase/permease subunit